MLIAFNKPMNILSQFTDEGKWRGLSGFGLPRDVYAAGRLDRDSEGLLLLTDDGRLQARISSPKFKMAKSYWALVEGTPALDALEALKMGIALKDGPTRRAEVSVIAQPAGIWPRDPPVRIRKAPDTWLALTIREGRNRQVRRMTAAVGHPTLRLVRAAIGPWALEGLAPGTWRELDATPPDPARKTLRLKR